MSFEKFSFSSLDNDSCNFENWISTGAKSFRLSDKEFFIDNADFATYLTNGKTI